MFVLDEKLMEKIKSKLSNNLVFCAINEVSCEEDCACKGGCGTYTPPCSCCAYD